MYYISLQVQMASADNYWAEHESNLIRCELKYTEQILW